MISIEKLDAASQQLDTAIELLFESRDIISIWTIANAASVIFSNLVEKKNPGASWDAIGAEANGLPLREWFNALRRTPNSFKHANNETDDRIEFEPGDVDHLIFIASLNHGVLLPTERTISVTQSVFQLWYIVKNADAWDAVAKSENFAVLKEHATQVVGELSKIT